MRSRTFVLKEKAYKRLCVGVYRSERQFKKSKGYTQKLKLNCHHSTKAKHIVKKMFFEHCLDFLNKFENV